MLIYTVPVDWAAEHTDFGSVCFNILNPLRMRKLPPSNPINKENFLVLAPSSYGILVVSQNYPVECGQRFRLACGVIIHEVRLTAQPSESNATFAIDEWISFHRSTIMVCRVLRREELERERN